METLQSLTVYDSMVNNAGIAIGPNMIHESTEEEWDKLMNANARSVFLGSKYAITQMLKQEPHASGDRGWIINMASIAGLVGVAALRKPTLNESRGSAFYRVNIRGHQLHILRLRVPSYR